MLNSPAPELLARARQYLSDGLLTRALERLEELTSGNDFGDLPVRQGLQLRFLVLHDLGMWRELATLCGATLSSIMPGAYPELLSQPTDILVSPSFAWVWPTLLKITSEQRFTSLRGSCEIKGRH